MAVRDDFAAGEVLAAADLNDTFASKLPYSYGTATPSTTDSGFLWFDSNSTPAATKFWDGSAFVPFGGKILQIVRATDTTLRTTTSTSMVDANISVTITPKKSDSAILLIWTVAARHASGDYILFKITDSSNNNLVGAGPCVVGSSTAVTAPTVSTIAIGYDTPATTAATTYKGRFSSVSGGQAELRNAGNNASQLIALEVSA